MEIRKTSANGIDGKHRASPPSAAKPRCPVQVVARCEQTASRPNAVAVSVRRGTGGRRETMQVRKAAIKPRAAIRTGMANRFLKLLTPRGSRLSLLPLD